MWPSAAAVRGGAVAVRWRSWRTERARPARVHVVVWAGPIRAGGAESADIPLSDRERVEGFQRTGPTAVAVSSAVAVSNAVAVPTTVAVTTA